jgi:4-amino-4-deoxy-L-arabinose transferase-like glycosyltransferase
MTVGDLPYRIMIMKPAYIRQQTHWLLLLPFITYLVFQAVLIYSVQIAQYDESIYLDVARNIRRTGLPLRSFGADGFLLLDQTPLYPYMLGGLTLVLGDNILLLRLVTVLSGLGSIVILYNIGRHGRGPVAGLAGAMLLAVNPFFILYSFFIRMELFFCFFLLLATYLLLHWEKTKRPAFIYGAGFAIAIATLFKLVAVFYCLATVLYILWRSQGWRQQISHALWLAGPTAIGLFLWLSMTLLEPERLQLRLARWFGAVGGSSPIVDPRMNVAVWPWLRSLGADVIGWGTVVLTAAVLLKFLVNRRRSWQPIAWLSVGYLLIVLLTSSIMQLKEQRHVIGLIPMTAVAIALMLDWDDLWTRLSRSKVPQILAITFAGIFLWFISPLNFPAGQQTPAEWWQPKLANRIFQNDVHLRPLAEVGLYLSTQSKPDDVIMITRQGPVVGYYADRSYLFLYTEPFETNMARLAETEIVVLDSMEFWQQTPEETETLLQYIYDHFTVVYQVNQVAVYRRSS